eukprot:12252880-Prorocentrum_lima.AAC.1
MKGSTEASFPKPGKDSHDLADEKAIVFSSSLAKLQHRFLRQQLLQGMAAIFLDSQCGGLPGRSTPTARMHGMA